MADSLLNLRPDSAVTAYTNGGWVPVGAANSAAATNDDNDATYTGANAFGSRLTLGLANTPLPGGASTRSVGALARLSWNGLGNVDVVLLLIWVPTLTVLVQTATFPVNNTLPLYYGSPSVYYGPNGHIITQHDLDENIWWQVQAYTYGGGGLKVHEAYVPIYYNTPPTLSADYPAAGATLTTTADPPVAWGYSDPEGDQQIAVDLRFFSGAAALNPLTETARLEDVQFVATNALSLKPTKALPNGDHTWAVRAIDAGSGEWGAFDTSTFTINVPPVGDPTILAAAVSQQAKTTVTVSEGTGVTPEWFDVQRSVNGGVDWVDVRPSKIYVSPNLLSNADGDPTEEGIWAAGVNVAATYPQIVAAGSTYPIISYFIRARAAAAGDMDIHTGSGHEVFVSANTAYRFVARANTVAGAARNYRIRVDWLSVGGTVLSTSTGSNVLGTPGTSVELVLDATAPTGAIKADVHLVVVASGAGEDHDFWFVRARLPLISVDDVAAEREISTLYRARGRRMIRPESTEEAPPSAWVTSSSVNLASDGKLWIMSQSFPNLSLSFYLAETEISSSSGSPSAVFPVWGRREYAATFGTVHGEVMPLQLTFSDDLTWKRFEALREIAEPLMFKTDFGDIFGREQMWGVIEDRTLTRFGRTSIPTRQWRQADIVVRETSAPVV